MKQTLLELLKAKFVGVSDKILDRVATKLAKTVTTKEEAEAAVEGYTFQNLLDAQGDFRANEASQSAVKNYEKLHSLKDGKKVAKEDSDDDDSDDDDEAKKKTTGKGDDGVPAWAKALVESNKTLAAELKAMKGEKVETSRRDVLNKLIKDLPETMRKAYARTPVKDLTDEEFDTLSDEIKTEVEAISKEQGGKKTVFGVPRTGAPDAKPTDKEVADIVSKMNV